jgi:hypothetical protein
VVFRLRSGTHHKIKATKPPLTHYPPQGRNKHEMSSTLRDILTADETALDLFRWRSGKAPMLRLGIAGSLFSRFARFSLKRLCFSLWRERERERERVCVCVCASVCIYVRVSTTDVLLLLRCILIRYFTRYLIVVLDEALILNRERVCAPSVPLSGSGTLARESTTPSSAPSPLEPGEVLEVVGASGTGKSLVGGRTALFGIALLCCLLAHSSIFPPQRSASPAIDTLRCASRGF